MYPSKLHLNDIPRGVRLPFARKKSYFLLKLYRLKSSDGATKAGIGNAEFSCPLTMGVQLIELIVLLQWVSS